MKAPLVLLAALSLTLAGCSSTFSSITPAGENTYYVTKNTNKFFKVSGWLYQCQTQGKKMVCVEVGGQ